MADEPELEPVDEDVDWQVDHDGTEFFVEDGVRWELAEDGYAYAVEDIPSPTEADGPETPGTDDDPEQTTVIPTVDTAAPPPEPGTAVLREGAPRASPRPGPDGDGELLRLDDVRSGYGKLPVLHGVGFGIHAGETAVLFGLNGAGKTTTAMNVCGAVDTWGGRITFADQDVTRWTTRQAVANGIVMVPEGRRVFPELSVERNLQVGAWSQRGEPD